MIRIALSCGLLAGFMGAQGVRAADSRPNVLLILGDDHAAYALSSYGHAVVKTPNLDRLAARGARFTHAYCNSPMCTPSRQSLLTGRMPHATQVTLLKSALGEDETTLAEVLQGAGYRTAAIGKMHFNSKLTHGFAERIDQPDHRTWLQARPSAPPADASATLGPWKPFRDPARVWLNSAALPYPARAAEMAGSYFAQQAAARLQQGDEPLFLIVSFYEPHSPFHFPLEYAGRVAAEALPVPTVGPEDAPQIPLIFRDLTDAEKRGIAAAYYTSVQFLDENVGRVLAALDASGRADNTLVIYAGDHGYLLGHHGRFEKHTFYEEAIRAPLMLAWPNHIAAGQQIDELVEFVDLFPTVVAACQATLPADRHGKSLLPLVDGSPPAPPLHDAVFGVYGENEEAMIRTAHWKLIYGSGTRARDDGYATDRPTPGRTVRLYDLAADPAEMHNLAADESQRERVAALEQRLVERLEATCRPGQRAPAGLTIEEQLDWYVFPPELRTVPGSAAR
ncbi:MAG: sulfatase-like hydrolase/transferase [Planctomycetaceae bacterium]|nr:sulfatase-like hydrolase/transferase [Planctomycetaceae bacterium]